MINWQYFPKTEKLTSHLHEIVEVFKKESDNIDSEIFNHNSNTVLAKVEAGFEALDYKVEKSKAKLDKIQVPVLFGLNGKFEKYFEADALNLEKKTVIEVEAGRGYLNNQFLKDLFQASVMHDIDYLVIAVRNIYKKSKDFEKIITFMDALFSSNRLVLPIKVLIIGY